MGWVIVSPYCHAGIFRKAFGEDIGIPRSREGFCRGLAIALAYCYGAGRKEKYEVRLRYRWRRLRRRHPGSPDVRGPRGIGAAGGAGPDYPQFQHLPEDIKFGYNTGGNAPPLRTSGGHPISLLDSRHNWQYVARATEMFPDMSAPRGQVTGGSSAINSSAFYRGVPEDFDHWAALGDDRWSFREVLPYFGKIETDVDHHDDFHGADGPIFVHHSRREDWRPAQEAF